MNSRDHEGREQLDSNSRFWHGIAREGWLGRQRLLLDVLNTLGYMEFESNVRWRQLRNYIKKTFGLAARDVPVVQGLVE